MFEGKAILCFHATGLLQGHCINPDNQTSPYSLAGQHLPDYTDPEHNDCMEPDEFYKVIIHSHDNNEDIELLLRRQKGNDASGLTTHENDLKCNNGYTLSFETEQFFAGSKAKSLMTTYFSSNGDQDVVICIGSIVLNQQDMN